jgi:hypothetical protein
MAAFQIKNALRETTEDILGREIIMKSMPLNRLNQKMLLIDGMSSLVLGPYKRFSRNGDARSRQDSIC